MISAHLAQVLNAIVVSLVIVHSVQQEIDAAGSDKTTKPPNIVLIMADDLGVECLRSYGGTSYATPNLNRMAREGLRFSHAYAQPLCTNTRVQLMTGKYNHRNWLAFGILDPNEKTIGHWMSEAGYQTCIAGKWQLQSYDPPDYPGAARRRGIGMQVENAGFDEFCLWHTGHTELKGSRYADPVVLENGKFRSDLAGRYGPDVWVEYINGFIERHRDQPFFVYYPMALPHSPMVPTPNSTAWQDPQRRHQADGRFIKDMVEYTDLCVGKITDRIDQLGLAEKTLMLFFSDNGTHRSVSSGTRSGPVQGGKGLTTNAGTHVPLLARWPGQIAPAVIDDLVDSTDLIPTLLATAGQPMPANVGLDGRSFYPRLHGQPGNPREWVYCYYDPRPGWDKDKYRRLIFARDRRFKLYTDGRLYDVSRDPLEQQAIRRDTDTDMTRGVRQRLAAVLQSMRG